MSPGTKCAGCRDGANFEVPITMAFQPIVDIDAHTVFAQEALVRGIRGEGAATILAQVASADLYAFDQKCRSTAIDLAAGLGFADEGTFLSINFLPNAVYEPRACIRLTLASAKKNNFPLDRIIFEFTEVEKLDADHLLNILKTYREMGFRTAIDDFGSGYAGLDLLSKFQPNIVKIDMNLIRNIDSDPVRRTIVKHQLEMLADLEIDVICEGIETRAEFDTLRDLGGNLMQGYLFSKPTLNATAVVNWPDEPRSAVA